MRRRPSNGSVVARASATTLPAYLEADAPRVSCPEHGVVVASVPWARHGAGHTYGFDDQAAWLATHCSKAAVRELLRVTWRTVGAIVTLRPTSDRARRSTWRRALLSWPMWPRQNRRRNLPAVWGGGTPNPRNSS